MPAPSHVQSAIAASLQPSGGGSTISSLPVSFTNPTVLGNSIVVLVSLAAGQLSTSTFAGGFAVSVSDGQGNVYQTALSLQTGKVTGFPAQGVAAFFVSGIPGGNVTVTVSLTNAAGDGSGNAIMVTILEYSGGITLDQTAFHFNVSGSSNSLSVGPSGATTTAAEVVICWGGDLTSGEGSASTLTQGAGFTKRQFLNSDGNSSNQYLMLAEDKTVAATGTQTGTITASTNLDLGGGLITFSQAIPPTNLSHNVDAFVTPPAVPIHFVDCDVQAPRSSGHYIDCYVQPYFARPFVDLADNLIPPIVDPNALVKLADNLLQPNFSAVNLETVLQAIVRDFVKLADLLSQPATQFVKLATNLNPPDHSHFVDCFIPTPATSFVQLETVLKQPLVPTGCDASFPDASFVKLQVWLVAPGQSQQAPGTGLLPVDDWLSSQEAFSAYSVVGQFVLAGVALIVTGFTAGVLSFQTRTRQWLRLVDFEPGGVVIGTQTTTRQLPNGQTITTVTTTKLVQDVTIVTAVTTYSSSNRVTTSITETNRAGQTVTRSAETDTINGVIHTKETKIVKSSPPTKDNIQPIRVVTLDGVEHFQFFGLPNTEWAGGAAEGTTETDRNVSIVPGNLNGQTVDQFGNPILARITDEIVTTPDGKVIETSTTETGIRDAGTTTTDTESHFNGIQTSTVVKTTYPDGSQTIRTTNVNAITGDSTETVVQTATDENGLKTTTTTVTETKTFQDPVNGNLRTQVTRTQTVQGPNGTTVDTTTSTRNNFEDDLAASKVKVYLINEFTVSCVIDRMQMDALQEHAIEHQKNFALMELLGQQLGNMDLSWPKRQKLINQFYQALNCIAPVQFQALGKTHDVVFAPSASSFRAKYIPGTQPAIFELQMILQERSDLVSGLTGF